MFILSKFSDLIRIEPSKFSKKTEDALEDEINIKYANKVVQDVGLCVCLYDILEVGDGLIRHGDGSAYIKTVFRLVVFRPFVGEILVGWISSCSEDGIKVRMGFFDDIFIPKEYLFEGCIFIPPEQAWIWRTEHDLYIDTNERIRFRIEQEIFTDQSPQGPNNTESADSVAQNGTDAVQQQQLLQNSGPSVSAPYSLIASCQAPGMGLVTWWD
ncbi:RNA polymerase III subunit Rpc25-domain-containing protein [Kockiozyma suomiensis]|uniref:RNA polymerase III subunit Rpc25-domain-containing protein n=1 Tax=Kockiozyma suomiensis TaxID=1337062 RepID=UPI003343D4ED